ncbi:MAG: GGDEF domain-containing protein [Planctomycetota bacterium]
MKFNFSIKTQRLKYKLWVVYALMFILPAIFLGYIILITLFPNLLANPTPVPILKLSLIFGGLGSVIISLGGLFLMSRSIKPVENITKEAENFMVELGKGAVILTTTRDEGEKVSQYMTHLIMETRTKMNEINGYAQQLAETNTKLNELAVKDGLTGLYNHMYIKERLNYELLRAREFSHPLSVIMADIDDFKQYNDRSGHLAGDQVLEKVARTIVKNIRPIDIPARYGGEEFIVILPGAESNKGMQIAEQIRAQISQLNFYPKDMVSPISLTISLGISILSEKIVSSEEIISQADEALYRSKRMGKNRVCEYINPSG